MTLENGTKQWIYRATILLLLSVIGFFAQQMWSTNINQFAKVNREFDTIAAQFNSLQLRITEMEASMASNFVTRAEFRRRIERLEDKMYYGPPRPDKGVGE